MELIINSKKHGQIKTIIDDEDYERIIKYKWNVLFYPKTKLYYIISNIDNKIIRLHRFLINPKSHEFVDHINRNTLDNRKENLRICTRTENNRNKNKKSNSIYSKYKGVCRHLNTKKFRAYIAINKKQIHLGFFEKEIDAAKAYNEAVKKHYGEFANLNIIEE